MTKGELVIVHLCVKLRNCVSSNGVPQMTANIGDKLVYEPVLYIQCNLSGAIK